MTRDGVIGAGDVPIAGQYWDSDWCLGTEWAPWSCG